MKPIQIQELNEIGDFLFEKAPPGWKPQKAYAKADKTALAWFPGNQHYLPEHEEYYSKQAALGGFSQLAFKDSYKPKQIECCICWVGLDLDADDNPDIDLKTILFPESSMRTSRSGEGVHVMYRLEKPIFTTTAHANRIIKSITEQFDTGEYHICKRDRRMFWLVGGKQKWLQKSSILLKTPDIAPVSIHGNFEKATIEGVSPKVQEWLQWFLSKNLIFTPKSDSIRVYIGDCVNALKERGERVTTKSRMSGNGQVNGYLDISKNRIQLWSYPDGYAIWSYTDVCSELSEIF